MTTRITPPLKWHGGKHYLANWVVSLMPRHLHYVEPYAGGLSVLLARDPADERLWLPGQKGVSEVVNDLDGNLTNFWSVLQSPALFPEFRRLAEATPFSESEWHAAGDVLREPAEDHCLLSAVAFFVRCRQSLAGRMRSFSPVTRTRLRRGMNGGVSEWLGAVEGLAAVHERLRRVLVLGPRPALEVIAREDGPGTLFYLDPPYLHETRSAPDAYAHEMTESDHRELLDAVRQCRGKVMLSGYPSRLYDDALAGWNRHAREVANHAAGGASKARETEVVWCNF